MSSNNSINSALLAFLNSCDDGLDGFDIVLELDCSLLNKNVDYVTFNIGIKAKSQPYHIYWGDDAVDEITSADTILSHSYKIKDDNNNFKTYFLKLANGNNIDSLVIPTNDNSFSDSSLIIKTIKKYNRIKEFSTNAFMYCKNLKLENNTFPPDVISVKANAFYGCNNFDVNELPNDVSYSMQAFSKTNMSSLAKFPEITSINAGFMSNSQCSASFSLPDTIVSIADYAFIGNTNLNISGSLPSGLQTLGISVFQGDKFVSLSGSFPDNLELINTNAFNGVKNITFNDFGKVDRVLQGAFKDSVIPKDGKWKISKLIGKYAFENAKAQPDHIDKYQIGETLNNIVYLNKKAYDSSFNVNIGKCAFISADFIVGVPWSKVENAEHSANSVLDGNDYVENGWLSGATIINNMNYSIDIDGDTVVSPFDCRVLKKYIDLYFLANKNTNDINVSSLLLSNGGPIQTLSSATNYLTLLNDTVNSNYTFFLNDNIIDGVDVNALNADAYKTIIDNYEEAYITNNCDKEKITIENIKKNLENLTFVKNDEDLTDNIFGIELDRLQRLTPNKVSTLDFSCIGSLSTDDSIVFNNFINYYLAFSDIDYINEDHLKNNLSGDYYDFKTALAVLKSMSVPNTNGEYQLSFSGNGEEIFKDVNTDSSVNFDIFINLYLRHKGRFDRIKPDDLKNEPNTNDAYDYEKIVGKLKNMCPDPNRSGR